VEDNLEAIRSRIPRLPRLPGSPDVFGQLKTAINKGLTAAKGPRVPFEERFKQVTDMLAPQLPANSPQWALDIRDRLNNTLAPALLNKWLPPIPKGLRDSITKTKI